MKRVKDPQSIIMSDSAIDSLISNLKKYYMIG